MNNIKSLVSKNKLLLQNFSFLSLLQIFNLLLPLITYPYLIRVLGKETYGLVIYSQSIVAYFIIVVNFGFNISATKDIAVNKGNIKKISEIVSSVFVIKSMLFLMCGILFFILIYFLPLFSEHKLLYIFAFGACLGEVLFPVWFYQGIEKMKYITFVNLSTKLFFTIFIFILIKSSDDYLWMPILMTLGSIIGGVLSFYFIIKVEKVQFFIPVYSKLLEYLRRTVPFFLSRLSAVLSSETNTVLIGTFIGYKEVAYYDLAKKIINILMIPNSIINTTVYPKIAQELNKVFVKNVFYLRIAISLIIYALLFVFSEYILLFLGGEKMLQAKSVLYLMGLLLPITAVSYYLGGTVLVAFNKEKFFNRSVFFSTLSYLILMCLLFVLNIFSLFNVIYVFLFTETLIASYRYYYTRKFKILLYE